MEKLQMTITESVWLHLQWYKAEVIRSLDNDNYCVSVGMFLQDYSVIAGMWWNLDHFSNLGHLANIGLNKTFWQIHKVKQKYSPKSIIYIVFYNILHTANLSTANDT